MLTIENAKFKPETKKYVKNNLDRRWSRFTETSYCFWKNKGYEVTSVNNVNEALELVEKQTFQLALLDENMPGISGLEAIPMIKNIDSAIKIVMVTKNEEEHIMEQAIGSQIADYILKPVNPNQVLLSLKKNLQSEVLVEQKTILEYQQEFRNLSMELSYLKTLSGVGRIL